MSVEMILENQAPLDLLLLLASTSFGKSIDWTCTSSGLM
jgi:hypothetical protein